MVDGKLSDADLVVAQSLRLTELDIQLEAIDLAHRKAVRIVRALFDALSVPLEKRLEATLALSELAGAIAVSPARRRGLSQSARCETVRVGAADGRCCARETSSGRRCTNLVAIGSMSICVGPHEYEIPTLAQIEAGVEPLPGNVVQLRPRVQR